MTQVLRCCLQLSYVLEEATPTRVAPPAHCPALPAAEPAIYLALLSLLLGHPDVDRSEVVVVPCTAPTALGPTHAIHLHLNRVDDLL